MRKKRTQPNYRRRTLRLPDLDHSKLAVLNSLGSPGSRRVYEYALDQFIAWYCSEPRLAFNRIVVTRYRMHLESRGLAANTINQQLAAVRRLANEADDAGLLSPELAAGISRVKGVKQLGFRAGNWLSAEQCSEVLRRAFGTSMRAKRDYAMLAVLFGCGLRRSELVGLEMNEVQMRQDHWAVVDLIGKGGHIRGASVTVTAASSSNSVFSVGGLSLPATIPAGQSVPFTITFSPMVSGTVTATLTLTSNANPATTTEGLTGSGTAAATHSVALSWNASTSSGIVGYNVYRAPYTTSCGAYAKLNPALNTGTLYTDATVANGNNYCYATTAVDSSSRESSYSNIVSNVQVPVL